MMKRLVGTLFLVCSFISSAAIAQSGLAPPNTVMAGPSSGVTKDFARPRALVAADLPSIPAGSLAVASGRIIVGQVSGFGSAVTVSGDCTISTAGALTCTKTNGVAFGALATVTPAAGCATWLATATSANLRGCVSDETGTGLLYFQGGDIGTPSAGVGTNLTALNAGNISTGTLAVARGGTGDTGTAWTAFTATPTCGTATFTTTSARWKSIGKTAFVELDITFTALGTCTNAITFTLPATAQSGAALAGRETVSAGVGAVVSILPAATTGTLTKASAAVFANGERYVVSGVYETQ